MRYEETSVVEEVAVLPQVEAHSPDPLSEHANRPLQPTLALVIGELATTTSEGRKPQQSEYLRREAHITELVRRHVDDPYVLRCTAAAAAQAGPMWFSEDPVSQYYSNIKRYSLTEAQVIAYFRDIERGLEVYEPKSGSADEQREALVKLVIARQVLFLYNSRFAAMLAQRYRGRLTVDQAIQEANLGLAQAIARFDVGKGYAFTTYAGPWIKSAITRASMSEAPAGHVPTNVAEDETALSKFNDQLAMELGRQPSDEELADGLGITREEVALLKRLYSSCVALDAPINGDPNGRTRYDVLANEMEAEYTQAPAGPLVDAVFSGSYLTPLEKVVLALHAGIRDVPSDVRVGRRSFDAILRKLSSPSPSPKIDTIARALYMEVEDTRSALARALQKARALTEAKWCTLCLWKTHPDTPTKKLPISRRTTLMSVTLASHVGDRGCSSC